MNPPTQAALRQVNLDFYSRHAAHFSRTRHAGGWSGWRRVVDAAASAAARPLRVLDLGCGNGRFALFLERNPQPRQSRPFRYLGIDLSHELIDRARAAAAGIDHVRFEVDDLETRPLDPQRHDLVALFGVLHHLPGFETRRRALERAAGTVAPGGLLALTCWQFADDPGFDRRRLDWSGKPAVDPAELEPGDHLLRWGPDGSGARRFCHHTDEAELDRLIAGLPLAEVARYRSDGLGGRQNLYWLGARDGAAAPPGYRWLLQQRRLCAN